MVKLQYTGKQYYITISEEHIKKMGWKKGNDLYVGRDKNSSSLYIERLYEDGK